MMNAILWLAAVVALGVIVKGVAFALGGRQMERADPAWAPSGYRYTHQGFDPELREQTAAKREREDEIRKSAARVASSPVRQAAALRRVVGGGR